MTETGNGNIAEAGENASDIAEPSRKIKFEGKSMADFTFFRRRKIANKEGEITGHALVVLPKDSKQLQIEYTCPYCKHKGYDEQDVPEPGVTKTGKPKKLKLSKKSIKIVCKGCGKTVFIPKLKD